MLRSLTASERFHAGRMNQHIALGVSGEELAAQYLATHGIEVIDRNWRCHAGEIDIVAVEQGLLVIVEVKTRSGIEFGHPFEALTPSKLARLYRLAVLWRVAHNWQGEFRIDAVAVLMPPHQPAFIEHLREVR